MSDNRFSRIKQHKENLLKLEEQGFIKRVGWDDYGNPKYELTEKGRESQPTPEDDDG